MSELPSDTIQATDRSDNNVEATERLNNSSRRDEKVWREFVAPSGKLKIVISDAINGAVVREIREGSPLQDVLFVGDRIVSIDDIKTRHMSARSIMQIMERKKNRRKKITVISSIALFEDEFLRTNMRRQLSNQRISLSERDRKEAVNFIFDQENFCDTYENYNKELKETCSCGGENNEFKETCSCGGENEKVVCSICLEDFSSSEKVVVHNQCKNAFHYDCLRVWMKENKKTTCPCCRGDWMLEISKKLRLERHNASLLDRKDLPDLNLV